MVSTRREISRRYRRSLGRRFENLANLPELKEHKGSGLYLCDHEIREHRQTANTSAFHEDGLRAVRGAIYVE